LLDNILQNSYELFHKNNLLSNLIGGFQNQKYIYLDVTISI